MLGKWSADLIKALEQVGCSACEALMLAFEIFEEDGSGVISRDACKNLIKVPFGNPWG